MRMPRFTPATEKVLRAAGWFPSRIINEKKLDSWLVINWNPPNCPPFGFSKMAPSSWEALSEFGGLTINPPDSSGTAQPFTLNPLLVTENLDLCSQWFNHDWTFGESLFPLGVVQAPNSLYGEIPLAMTTDGRVILIHGVKNTAWDTMDEALEKLISGEGGKQINTRKNRGTAKISHRIIEKIIEREGQLMQGQWPEPKAPRSEIKGEGYAAILDWEAESKIVARAFDTIDACSFVGPRNWKALRRNIGEGWGLPSLSNGLSLQIQFRHSERTFSVTQGDRASAHIIIEWDGNLPPHGLERMFYEKTTECDIALARGLYCLGLLTSEIEAALEITVTNHQKAEWLAAIA